MTDPVLDLAPRGSISIDCVVNGPISTNTYFVVSGDEALIIDPAWEGDKLAERLRAAHPGARPVGIVCTHGHGDHVGGVAGMRRALGDDVPYLISASDAGFVRDAVASMRVRWGIDTEMPPAPDRLLSEGDTVAVGDAVLQVIDAPGHTPGGIVLFCASAEGRVAFMGDTLFPGGVGKTDSPQQFGELFSNVLEKLFGGFEDDAIVLPGHGRSTTLGDERPHLEDWGTRGW